MLVGDMKTVSKHQGAVEGRRFKPRSCGLDSSIREFAEVDRNVLLLATAWLESRNNCPDYAGG